MDAEIDQVVELSLAASVPLPKPTATSVTDVASNVTDTVELTLLGHEGFVVLDPMPNDTTILTHRLTIERITLPGHGWTLEFDDEGFGLAMPDYDTDAIIHCLESSLKFQLYTNPSKEYVIMKTDSSEGIVHLNTFMKKWTSARVGVLIGPNKCNANLDVAMLRWPRMGARIVFSCTSLYTVLALDQFKGQPWRWVNGSWKRWQKHMHSFGLQEHVLGSSAMEDCLFL